jgi:hypothetical protein
MTCYAVVTASPYPLHHAPTCHTLGDSGPNTLFDHGAAQSHEFGLIYLPAFTLCNREFADTLK